MTDYKTITSGLLEGTAAIPYQEAHKTFQKLYKNYKHKFLFESKDVSDIYGRLSLIGIDPALKISGKNNSFRIESLNDRGVFFIKELSEEDFKICDSFQKTEKVISGKVIKKTETIEESERSRQKNIAQILRIILNKFHLNERGQIGLYGGFSYDFIRQFEDIACMLKDNDINDYTLFLYDTFIFFDHLKESSQIILYRNTTQTIDREIEKIKIQITTPPAVKPEYKITGEKFTFSQKEYEKLVQTAQQYALEGELFEVVFSNILKAKFDGDPFALYLKYRKINPSPYLFFFDFGDEQLIGASPEMMVRVEQNIAHLRPISGTIERGADPIEDHENMLKLLSDKKEKAELDMLIDLGRNDLSRVCKPGLIIKDYRYVEKYSRVMHTIAHLTGELKDGYSALDALIACINAGTLTGAPKVAAMNTIEKHEKERRGYYGGTIGYFTFSGNMDTGIIIRTAHIKNNRLRFQVGATLLYDSVPEKEYQETMKKARAFLETFA